MDKMPIQCGACAYWWRPNDQPVTARFTGHTLGLWAIEDDGWWDGAGYCVRQTAPPGAVMQMVHPRVTHGQLDGCGDGETPDAVRKKGVAERAEVTRVSSARRKRIAV